MALGEGLQGQPHRLSHEGSHRGEWLEDRMVGKVYRFACNVKSTPSTARCMTPSLLAASAAHDLHSAAHACAPPQISAHVHRSVNFYTSNSF